MFTLSLVKHQDVSSAQCRPDISEHLVKTLVLSSHSWLETVLKNLRLLHVTALLPPSESTTASMTGRDSDVLSIVEMFYFCNCSCLLRETHIHPSVRKLFTKIKEGVRFVLTVKIRFNLHLSNMLIPQDFLVLIKKVNLKN